MTTYVPVQLLKENNTHKYNITIILYISNVRQLLELAGLVENGQMKKIRKHQRALWFLVATLSHYC